MPCQVVRSLFHNKGNQSLIIVSVFARDQYSSLHCRANALADLKHGIADRSTQLFGSESLRWPGFVEFDDVNQKRADARRTRARCCFAPPACCSGPFRARRGVSSRAARRRRTALNRG